METAMAEKWEEERIPRITGPPSERDKGAHGLSGGFIHVVHVMHIVHGVHCTVFFCQSQEEDTDKVTHHFFRKAVGHMVHCTALMHGAAGHVVQMSIVHVGMSVHMVQMPNVGHKPMIKRRKMMMVRVMPVMMFRRVMVLLVHMYMKLLFLLGCPSIWVQDDKSAYCYNGHVGAGSARPHIATNNQKMRTCSQNSNETVVYYLFGNQNREALSC